jgi:choline dehydrogenase-like flavoprotein
MESRVRRSGMKFGNRASLRAAKVNLTMPPHARGGRIVGAPVWRFLQAFRKRTWNGVQSAPLLTLSERSQRELEALNSSLTIAVRPPSTGKQRPLKRVYLHAKHQMAPDRVGRTLWKGHRRLGRSIKQIVGPLRPWWACIRGNEELALVLRAEQAPNRNSRVTLGPELDAIGMPRVQLNWQMSRLDRHSVAALVDAFSIELATKDLGICEPAEWLRGDAEDWVTDDLISAHPLGGYHHMGTTRMSDDPRRGVADSWGRVHGIDNLYVAGSSLFPTSGWANPTLTIVALALRQSSHLLAR